MLTLNQLGCAVVFLVLVASLAKIQLLFFPRINPFYFLFLSLSLWMCFSNWLRTRRICVLFSGRFLVTPVTQQPRWNAQSPQLNGEIKFIKHHADNNINWFVENSPSFAIGSSCTENRSLFRIWCSCVNFIDGNICIDRPLVSMHMVCISILYIYIIDSFQFEQALYFIRGEELMMIFHFNFNQYLRGKIRILTLNQNKKLFTQKLWTISKCPYGI